MRTQPSALALAVLATSAHGYAEGNAAILSGSPSSASASLVFEGGDVGECAVVHPGAAEVRMTLTLPEDAIELRAPVICVTLYARSDRAPVWWFVAPPKAEAELLACSATAGINSEFTCSLGGKWR